MTPTAPPVDDRRHPPYNTEAVMWADFIAEQKPGANVAQLVFNNDFGKAYRRPSGDRAREGLEVVESQLHEGTATSIDNEITALLPPTPMSSSARQRARSVRSSSQASPPVATRASSSSRRRARRWRRSSSRSTRRVTACTSSSSRRTRATRSAPTIPADGRVQGRHGRVRREPDPNNGQHLTGYNLAALQMVDTLERATAIEAA